MSLFRATVAGPGRAARLILVMLVVMSALAGCSPRYDWREIRAADDGFVAMMPGRPDRMTRPVDLGGIPVSMTMHGVRVDGVAFTVASARLPDESVATRERALAAMREAMLRNIGAGVSKAEALAVPVVDASGRRTGSAPGWRVEAEGLAAGRPVSLRALFAARQGRIWQAVVVGPGPEIEQVRLFIDGFRIAD
jgi:hypothetical protein